MSGLKLRQDLVANFVVFLAADNTSFLDEAALGDIGEIDFQLDVIAAFFAVSLG